MKKTIRFVSTELFQQQKRNNLLEMMAKQGWCLKKAYGLFWLFQKQKKADVHFSSMWHYFKNGEEEKKEDMIAFVEEGGWQYVTSCGYLHIFKTEDENAAPLETDAVMTIEALHKTMWKSVILPVLAIVAAGVLFVGMHIHNLLTSPLYSFGGADVNWALMVIALLVLSAIAGIVFLISYFNWYRKAVRTAKEENAVSPYTAFPSLAITFGLLYQRNSVKPLASAMGI